ncbi:hypothetical protein IH922_04420, partial [candidate division KSB1 bacterium]|nr:hypothetical protein [candidate division KSB1 bacterium]
MFELGRICNEFENGFVKEFQERYDLDESDQDERVNWQHGERPWIEEDRPEWRYGAKPTEFMEEITRENCQEIGTPEQLRSPMPGRKAGQEKEEELLHMKAESANPEDGNKANE